MTPTAFLSVSTAVEQLTTHLWTAAESLPGRTLPWDSARRTCPVEKGTRQDTPTRFPPLPKCPLLHGLSLTSQAGPRASSLKSTPSWHWHAVVMTYLLMSPALLIHGDF